jgi:hypothetical protein
MAVAAGVHKGCIFGSEARFLKDISLHNTARAPVRMGVKFTAAKAEPNGSLKAVP